MRPAAVAQTDDLLPIKVVQFLWHDGAHAVPGAQTAAAVQAQHKDLGKTHSLFSSSHHYRLESEGEGDASLKRSRNTFKPLKPFFLSNDT